MLMKCPECELQVSDKAAACPHCGYPLKTQFNKVSGRKNKRKRLPNGFGSITKLDSKKYRKPFLARVSVGKDENGKPIQKVLKPNSMFTTYNEAYEALVEYNRNPYELSNDITVQELYVKWTDIYFEKKSESSKRTIVSAWIYCTSVYSMRAKDIRARHIKGCMDNGYRIENVGKNKGTKIYPSANTKSRIKSMFNLMLDYALEYEIVDRNYARTFDISNGLIEDIAKNQKKHIIFSEEEISLLWDNVDKVKYVDWILIQIYMGWRPQELATLKLDEIDMEELYMKAGMKTDAGKQRIVPIHSKIIKLVNKNIIMAKEIGSEYLLNDKGQTHAGVWKLTYDKYANRFKKVINQLGLNPEHRPHDPRMTFITRCKKAGVDEYALKEMVGHSIRDITESVYTVRDLEWLRSDLEKMQ